MTTNYEKSEPRSRVNKNSPTFLVGFLIVAALLTAAFYFYIDQNRSSTVHGNQDIPKQAKNTQNVIKTFVDSKDPQRTPGTNSQTNIENSQQHSESLPGSDDPNSSPPHSSQTSFTDNGHPGSQSIVLPTIEQPNLESPNSINSAQAGNSYEDELIKQINDFYAHLDKQSYMKLYKIDTSSKVHFSSLLQKLVDNPPVVTRETDDLFTLLKNTAHFFRVLGKDNILMLKGILDREKKSFENILKSFYSLTKYPNTLKNEYSLTISVESLYDYAGFFLNTMGGRLYLFRRDSTSRMTVSFYAILVIDSVKDAENDRHGLDLIQPIDSLIDEIENAGNRLRLKEDYLDILYDLKEKYSLSS